MKILFNDVAHEALDAPKDIIKPGLTGIYSIYEPIVFHFGKEMTINSIGVGNLKGANTFSVKIGDDVENFTYDGSGLYLLSKTYKTTKVTFLTAGTSVGRIGLGVAVNIPTSISKDFAYASTAEPRLTLSGTVVLGLGGYTYRRVGVDSRYKLNREAIEEIYKGRKRISEGYPFFINFEDEAYKLPFTKLYANDLNQQDMSFEGGVRDFRYSRRFEFEERF